VAARWNLGQYGGGTGAWRGSQLLQDVDRGSDPERGALTPLDGCTLIDAILDPVFATNRERKIVYWNHAAESTYGFGREEALGRRPAELLQTRFPIPLAEIEETLADTGLWAGSLVQFTKDAHKLTVETRRIPRYDRAGRRIGVIAIDRDMTALLADAAQREEERLSHARLQVEFERTQRLESVGQVAGGIAHDFNNILGVINIYATHVAGELRAPEGPTGDRRWASMLEHVKEIEIAAASGARLTQQLLAFSRQDASRPVALDLNETICGVEDLLRKAVGAGVQLVTSLAEHLHPIHADRGQLEQVLINVAVNSRDAMPDGGTLTISTENVEIDAVYAAPRLELHAGAYVRLLVSDTGMGMDRNVLRRAFDPFFTTKEAGRGTGLGLASVYGIIARSGGHAELDSEPGVGTTFNALIPAGDTVPAPAQPEGPPEAVGAGIILLVEDKDPMRDAVQRILASAGYRVIAAAGGSEALAAACSHLGAIDLLLTDVVMPGMRGDEVAEQLLAVRPSIRVLYMSGFAEPFLGQSMQVDDVHLLEKPFTAQALLARVQRALSA
jgi:PAS domain S-box-containing protein